MKINRENFLNDLQMVRAGLSPKEHIEQSSKAVFRNGEVMTYNDEIACRKPMDYFQITGAVAAMPLLTILEKIDDDELEVIEEDSKITFRGKSKTFSVTKESEIYLPIDQVEAPEKWKKLPEEFAEALELVARCVSTDETRFILTCIRITPEFMEACDNRQALRFAMQIPIKEPCLIRGDAIKHISALGMTSMSITPAWVHFKNTKGLIYSIRRHLEDSEKFPALDEILEFKGTAVQIPKGVMGASERANVFAADRNGADPVIMVTLIKGKIRISGEGLQGSYRETKKTSYDGSDMRFLISPEVLSHVSEKYQNAKIDDRKLRVKGPKWEYATVLSRADEDFPKRKKFRARTTATTVVEEVKE